MLEKMGYKTDKTADVNLIKQRLLEWREKATKNGDKDVLELLNYFSQYGFYNF